MAHFILKRVVGVKRNQNISDDNDAPRTVAAGLAHGGLSTTMDTGCTSLHKSAGNPVNL